MLPLLLPIGVGLLAGISYLSAKNQMTAHGEGEMTAPRQIVYDLAMTQLKEPEQLDQLSAVFGSEGLPDHAAALAARANLRRLPASTKQARRAAFRKAMRSKDKQGVKNLAAAFGAEGCTGAQLSLERYADGIDDDSKGGDGTLPGDVAANMVGRGAGYGYGQG